MFANAIVAAALTFAAATGGTAGAPLEDEPGFDCATQGNHICGPKGDAPAGLYRDGHLIQPWTNYEHPEQDPLYGVMPGTEYDLAAQVANLHLGCWIEHKVDLPAESLYGDLALMPADATPIPCGQEDEALEYGETFVAVDAEPHNWEAEGYSGTDASLAQFAYDHGLPIEGYGVDASKVYDRSQPYGWKANHR